MSVSRETNSSFSEYFNKYVKSVSSGAVSCSEAGVVPLLVGSFPGSYLVVDDNLFENLFYLLYKQDSFYFSIITGRGVASPPGFGSPLDRYKKNASIYRGLKNQLILIDRSSYDLGVFSLYQDAVLFTINAVAAYDDLISALKRALYVKVATVAVPGTFAVRGSVVDFFPNEHHSPLRVDFSFEEANIYVFDAPSQTTISRLDSFVFSVEACGQKDVCLDVFLEGMTQISFEGGVFSWGKSSKKCLGLSIYNYDTYDSYSSGFSFAKDLHSWGISFNGVLFAPSWFFEGNLSSPVETKAFPLGGLGSLSLGDYVIHEDYGVGIFLSFIDTESGNDTFLSIGFQDAKINVHLSKINLIGYYAEASTPGVRLASISKQGVWKRKKASVSNKIDSFISSLYEKHVKRASLTKTREKVDRELLSSFVGAFKFKDTPDQEVAFSEITEDLLSPLPMDRLLCGDVGFGKTEIAMRAAFVSILQGGRVVVLCPTTVLCYQLFGSFSSRLSSFSVEVGMVSRLNSKKAVESSVNFFNSGKIDVLVSTHRIFSYLKKINRVDLLVVDEEHRFGVKQKEAFPSAFPLIDQLSLSATPIPRSLQSSLVGIKTMSIMSTPPVDRLPIQTSIEYFNLDRILDYIKHERARGGQVYFLYNNIDSLNPFKRKLVSNYPGLRVCVIHAKMSSKKIKDVLLSFVSKEFDLLLSTSIIENGLDIPNVNTIIINNAHLFGLSQLHQIRGRVGRHHRQAFAHLLIPAGVELQRDSRRRLKAIEENVSLGSGYAISSKDLEIRGAGTVFGYAQSGGADIGFELYNKFITKALSKDKGSFFDSVFVDIFGGAAHVPSSQIKDPELRVSIYKQLSSINSPGDLSLFYKNIENRFGSILGPFDLLFKSHSLKIKCFSLSISSIYSSKGLCSVVLLPSSLGGRFSGFLSWVDVFFKKERVEYTFKELAGKKLSVSFSVGNKNKDILVFINNFLDKFKYEFFKK